MNNIKAVNYLSTIILIVFCASAYSYEAGSSSSPSSYSTHEFLSKKAYAESYLSNGFSFSILDINSTIALDNIIDGSRLEDEGFKSLSHFVDPQNSNRGAAILSVPLPVPNSPDWILEDFGDSTLLTIAQDYSYKDARQYFFDGFTKRNVQDRISNQKKMFRSLGHVIHHLQDMAQPQHVRNDMHCNAIPCALLEVATGIDIHQPSEYENYSAHFLDQQTINNLYDASIYGISGYSDFVSIAGFAVPRDYFLGHKGMATFSSNNFLTVDTNFRSDVQFPLGSIHDIIPSTHPEYSLPNTVSAKPLNMRTFTTTTHGPAAGGLSNCSGCPIEGNMYFFNKDVFDSFSNQNYSVQEFSTFSVFDDALIQQGLDPIFVQNRITFEARYEVLIPRAVAFSAAMIDYFFRGDLTVELINPVTYRVHNNSNENMTPGTLYVVIEDSAGLREIVEIYANVRIPVGSSVDINIDYSDIARNRLNGLADIVNSYIVYDGKMGAEPRAIVIARNNIAVLDPIGSPPIQHPVLCDGGTPVILEGGSGTFIVSHKVGTEPGYIYFWYDFFTIPDTVIIDGNLVANGSGQNCIEIYYPGGADDIVNVVVDAPFSGTRWGYSMSCPQVQRQFSSGPSYLDCPVSRLNSANWFQ